MATQGPTLVGSGATAAGAGQPWLNPGNITASDGVFATCALGAGTTSNGLQGTMGANAFTVPAGSTILGIQVDISRLDSLSNEVDDSSIKIIKGGVVSGTSQSAGALWPAVQTTATFGGPSNLWGLTWTAADVNASNFGVQFIVADLLGSASIASVDWIKITITYTPPPSVGVSVGALFGF